MAPKKAATATKTEDQTDIVRLFKAVLRNTSGEVDFEQVAIELGIANGEAA